MGILKPTFRETLRLLDDEYNLITTVVKQGHKASRAQFRFSYIVNNWIVNGVE